MSTDTSSVISQFAPPLPDAHDLRVAILTSGGDAPGMNGAVRAVARTALQMGAQPWTILEGWRGVVEGGDMFRPVAWDDLGSILGMGGTAIGSARSDEFRLRDGMRKAAVNLVSRGIDRLVVVGGDGTLMGAEELRELWPELLDEAVAAGDLDEAVANKHATLHLVGLAATIDNDLVGTDMTIGADSALHRIVNALDELSATAASHQRTFVVEVMGRHCGYLPLMSAVAGGCDWVLTPESRPVANWRELMCEALVAGRRAGRRDSLVVVAEGALDEKGERITAHDVATAIQEQTGESARVTILGHIQRGGRPTAYDRWMPTLLGHSAALNILNPDRGGDAEVMVVRGNRVSPVDLTEAVTATRAVAGHIKSGNVDAAMASRGNSFRAMTQMFSALSLAPTGPPSSNGPRVGIVHGGGLAPGMNAAARNAVRLGLSRGWTMVGIHGGFPGFVAGNVTELTWSDVDGWGGAGGAHLGTKRGVPGPKQFYRLARTIEDSGLDAVIVIGGFDAYLAAHAVASESERFPAFEIPIVCVPTSIDNNLPGTELTIGADTALNTIIDVTDRLRQSASAARRSFVVETMGRQCGYLAMMSAISSGAEQAYLNEDPPSLADLARDASAMRDAFSAGRRLFLTIRNEDASPGYSTELLSQVFTEESDGLFDVRTSVVGHMQQGGDPTPFDRLLAARLANRAVEDIADQFETSSGLGRYVGLEGPRLVSTPLEHLPSQADMEARRPHHQWWFELRGLIPTMSDASAAVAQADDERAGAT